MLRTSATRRRPWLLWLACVGLMMGAVPAFAQEAAPAEMSLATVATASTSFVSGHETIAALNDGSSPAHSDDKRSGAYGNWPRSGTQWVEYAWPQPVSTARIEVYWFDDARGVRLPRACRLKYWDGTALVEVNDARGPGLEANRFNTATFTEVTTTRLRLEMDSSGTFSTGILEWRVIDSGRSPNFPPHVEAGVDRVAVLPGATYLRGIVQDDGKPNAAPAVRWDKAKGPGEVTFSAPQSLATEARFSRRGKYVLRLTADDGQQTGAAELEVTVQSPPPGAPLEPVWTGPYRLTSAFWLPRVKAQIVHWIPHCAAKIDDPKLPEGGIENFAQAAEKLAGRPAEHAGPPWANAWVYNTVESMCWALMVDAGGDPEILQAQARMRETLDAWIPKILAAQEPDGYLHTMYTCRGIPRWTNRHDHEGYCAGYFIEAAIAHHAWTEGKDARLLDAACRLADCWWENIGPAPKREWYDGHQALEMALVKLARHVDRVRGEGAGRRYFDLAKYLVDSRRGGEEYDQSHLPLVEQYEAVGHSVRAAYCYTGLTDVAIGTGQADYLSAALSLSASIADRKYYVTGGLGSGETSEGFGKEYSLPVSGYCESCAGCGQVFFQHRLGLCTHNSLHADLAEETLYNAVLGSVDLAGENFTYTNSLDSSETRYKWHGCPCCVGNIPRTLLQLPTWMYATGAETLYVNQFIASDVRIEGLPSGPVGVVQTTDYPWNGKVRIELRPESAATFTVNVRVPNRTPSALYTGAPPVDGFVYLGVNGEPAEAAMKGGYASITRAWKPGDAIELDLPLEPQRVHADDRIAATRGRVALRYGPLVYNIESADQPVEGVLAPDAPLTAEWRADLLGGVVVFRGAFADGSPLLAIPNYARLNRGGRSLVWIQEAR